MREDNAVVEIAQGDPHNKRIHVCIIERGIEPSGGRGVDGLAPQSRFRGP